MEAIMVEVISSAEAQNNFGALLDKVQRTPVIIQRHKRDCAMMMSMEEYTDYRLMKNRQLLASMERLGREAVANGLTPEILAEILADDA
jgi:prevent-host-death family protein